MTPRPRFAGRLAVAAVAAIVPAALLVYGVSSLDLWGAAFVVLLVVLLPVISLAQLQVVQQEASLARVPVYLSSAVVILLIGGLGLVLGLRTFGAEEMGLTAEPLSRILALTLGLCLASALLMGGFFGLRRALGLTESRLLTLLLPRTPTEKTVFVFLSLGAGWGEEVAFRGFLLPALTTVVGWDWAAAMISSAAFGVLHAYQGWIGIFRTGALGLVFAVSLMVTGTLWPAVLTHAILDILAGLAFGEILVKD